MQGGTHQQRIRKRPKYLMPLLIQFLITTTSSWSTWPLELKDREQNEDTIIQVEMLSDLLHHLDAHKYVALKEVVEVLTNPLSIICQLSIICPG